MAEQGSGNNKFEEFNKHTMAGFEFYDDFMKYLKEKEANKAGFRKHIERTTNKTDNGMGK